MAAEIHGAAKRLSHPCGTHIWLALPPLWTGEIFAAEALARGVAVTAGNAFAVEENANAMQAIRLCIGAESDRDRIRDGLEIVSGLLRSVPPAVESIV